MALNPNGIKRKQRGLAVIRDHRQGPDLAPDHDPDLRIIFAAIEKEPRINEGKRRNEIGNPKANPKVPNAF